MVLTNFSGVGTYKMYEQLYCTPKDLVGIGKELLSLSVVNILLSITAFLGNSLILVALHKESSLHPPSRLLFRSLSASDLCVGLISEPLVVTYWLSVVNEDWSICRYALTSTFVATYILGPVSLLTLTAISVDRLLALLLGLRYRQVVTLKRTWVIVISPWAISTVAASMYFWDYHITLWYGIIVTSLCLLTSIFSYTKIFINLHARRVQVQDQVKQEQMSQANQLNMARYRKAVSSALWLQLTLVFCYLPHGIVGALWANDGFSVSMYLARQFASTLVFFNSSLNPILYCWKIKEIRQAVKDTIRQICCSIN